MATEKKFKFVPTEKAKKKPVRFVKRGYAIGGSVTVEKAAPNLSYTVPEATAAQYEEYYNICKGETSLVKKIEA